MWHLEAILLLYHCMVNREVEEVLSQILCLFSYKKQRKENEKRNTAQPSAQHQLLNRKYLTCTGEESALC